MIYPPQALRKIATLASLAIAFVSGCTGKTENVQNTAAGVSPSSQPVPNASPKEGAKANQPPEYTAAEPLNPTSQPADSEAVTPNESAAVSRFRFAEQADERGIRFGYKNGEETGQFAILENLGGGVGVIDYNCDGRDDILLAGGGIIASDQSITGLPLGLFTNHDGQFIATTLPGRLSIVSRYTHGICVFDFDNDGFQDALVTGYGGASLFVNLGDGTFHEHQDASTRELTGIVTSAAAGDFNRDGMPDLYVATYVDWSFDNHPFCPAPTGDMRELCSPKEFSGTQDYLLMSRGDGTFDWVQSLQPGIGKGLGVLAVDVDQDADVDIYVANDTEENFLFINDGQGNFEEVAMLSGVALDERGLPNGSMGLTACDVDDDLQIDLWVANYERESFALYRNEQNSTFLHTSRRYGISALGGLYVGFGTDWEDFDADGREEIVVTNGHVLKYPTGTPRRQRPLLLARDDQRFELQNHAPESYFSGRYEGRGLAVGDFNDDRRPDIVISHINENAALLINATQLQGRFIRVRLIGIQSSRCPTGATVILTAGNVKQLRSVVGGGSYLSSNSPVLSFGVPKDCQVAALSILWPSGKRQEVEIQLEGEETVVVEPQNNENAAVAAPRD